MSKKGNLLVISWNPGGKVIAAGGFRRACEIVNRFPESKGKVTIIDSYPTYFDTKRPNSKMVLYRVPKVIKKITRRSFILGRIMDWAFSSTKIYSLARKYRKEYDIVYVPYSEMFVVTIASYLIKVFLKKEVIFCNQNKDYFRPKLLVNNFFHRRADKIISVSNQLAKELEDQGKKKPVYSGMVGLNYDEVVNTPNQEKKYDAIYIGRHVESKGVYDYAKMLVEIVKTKPNFKFVSVGICTDKVQDEIKLILKEGGAEKNWQYLGIVDDEEKLIILKQSRCVWFLSSVEGWGIVPQEALAAEVTPICYDIPVYAEHIKNTEAAILVPNKNWRAALLAYNKYLKLPRTTVDKLHKEGREFVKKYTWDNVAKREFEIIYEETSEIRL